MQVRKKTLIFCFTIILLAWCQNSLASHPHPPIPPEQFQTENPISPRLPEVLEKPETENGFFWVFFNIAWLFAIGLIYWVFYEASRRRKELARYKNDDSEDSEKPPELLSASKLKLVFWASGFLVVDSLILMINGYWLIVILIFASLGYICYSFNDAFAEAFLSLKQNFSSDIPQPKISPDDAKTFQDVGGLGEAIEELSDLISLFKNPSDARAWDIQPTSGILLIGPPGNGKTLLARAIAGEAGMPFFPYAGAEIGTSYVRSGAQQIKGIFQEAREKAPCVIFIDEIDALGQKRGFDTSHEFDHSLNSLLYEMDGIPSNKRVLVLAATNREDVLDPALLRRFGKKILIPPPDSETREQILKVHTSKKPLSPDVDLKEIAHRTAGFSGSALKDLVNEAAQLARRRCGSIDSNESVGKYINMSDCEEGMLRALMGPARKLIMNEEDRKVVAYHEMGHAIVTAEMGLEVLKKVMLMPRNWALGLTISQGKDRQVETKPTLLARITSLLAGRAAEEVIFGQDAITTSGANDIERAMELARLMICEWGMGREGPKFFYKLAPSNFGQKPSEYSAAKIDEEVGEVITTCYNQAKEIILDKKDALHDLANRLMEKVVLDAEEILDALKKEN